MQKHLPALVLATLAVTLVAATLSMLTFLRQRDLAVRVATLQQRISAHERAHVEQVSGQSIESILKDLAPTDAAPPEAPAPPSDPVKKEQP